MAATRRHIVVTLGVCLCNILLALGQTCGPGLGYTVESNCSVCVKGTYKNTSEDEPCAVCPTNTTTLSTGSTSPRQCILVPSVSEMYPEYGPQAGGTLVTFHIQSLGAWNLTSVFVGDLPCANVSCKMMDTCTCGTSKSDNLTSNQVMLTFSSDDAVYHLITHTRFRYRDNPSIITVTPNTTVVSGGLSLTVLGESLASIAFPVLTVTVIPTTDEPFRYNKLCNVSSNSIMECPMPDMYRRVRDTGTSRSITEDFGWLFFVGFTLDGVTSYNNISGVIANFNRLDVFTNPLCKERDFKYSKDTNLHIEGRHLNYAFRKEDISVKVGKTGVCKVIELKTNAIICKPPESPPDGQQTPLVIVSFGASPVIYTIGSLTYDSSGGQWQVALGVGFGVVAILVLIGVVVVVTLRRRRRRKDTTTVKRQASKPNDYVHQHRGSVNEGYLAPTPSPTYSGQSRPSLEDLQHRASLASLTLSLVKQRSSSVGSVISSPPLTPSTPLSSILENNELSFPTQPSVPMSTNMAYFLQPHKSGELNDDLPILAVQSSMLDMSRLKLGESIGKGFFGKVYKGVLLSEDGQSSSTVAVKTVHGMQYTDSDVIAFLQEAIIMKSFNHDNVLSLLGVVMDEGRPYVILPFMEYGDLTSFVSDASRQFTVLLLLGFGVHVARGMAYLAEQKFVHRDLACRNCMINEKLMVKIADFGLSRDVYHSQYYRVETKHRPLPVKWMAIESLVEGVFSTKTDVWSFGVLLWELMTRGCPPYADVDSYKMKSYLKSGRRLAKPEHASDQIYDIMSSCWRELPEDRPSFSDLERHLQDIIEDKKPANDYLMLVE